MTGRRAGRLAVAPLEPFQASRLSLDGNRKHREGSSETRRVCFVNRERILLSYFPENEPDLVKGTLLRMPNWDSICAVSLMKTLHRQYLSDWVFFGLVGWFALGSGSKHANRRARVQRIFYVVNPKAIYILFWKFSLVLQNIFVGSL